MCNIDNHMYGKTGAAYIFGPQKGANPEMVESLDQGLMHVSKIITRDLCSDISFVPGSGAAEAMGAGMLVFFWFTFANGIETVLDTVNFDKGIAHADMIFTGEGKIDTQSLSGKVVIGVAKRARKQNVPLTVIVGGEDDNIEQAYEMGVGSIFTINKLPMEFAQSKVHSAKNLEFTVDNILRLMKSINCVK